MNYFRRKHTTEFLCINHLSENIPSVYSQNKIIVFSQIISICLAINPTAPCVALRFSNVSKQTIKILVRTINTDFKDHLCNLQNNLTIRLIIVGSITVDCRNGDIDPMSQAFIQMSAVFSELELSIIRARVRSGMRNAKEKGIKVHQLGGLHNSWDSLD